MTGSEPAPDSGFLGVRGMRETLKDLVCKGPLGPGENRRLPGLRLRS